MTFIEYTDQFIYCSIPDVKDKDISDVLKSKAQEDKDVKLIFDRTSAFTNCNVACVPRVDSKYNTLYSNDVEISVGDLNAKYCVNEKGVLFFSSNAVEITEIHLFYNEKISSIYKDHFDDLYN